MQKKFAVLGLTAGLMGGSLVGVALGVPGLAGATSGTVTVTAAGTPLAQTPDTTTPSTGAPDPAARGQWMRDAVNGLVTAGTIDQEQADAVIAAIEAAKPERPEGHGHRGGRGERGGRIGLDAAATALGLTADELRTELQAGSTIAAVAQDKGVDVATVIAAMVDDAKAHLAEEVAEGDLTQEQADAKAAQLEARITDVVNNGGPGRGR